MPCPSREKPQSLQLRPSMNWFTLSILLFNAIVVTAILGSFVLLLRFQNSVAKQWAIRVLLLSRDAEKRARSANRALVRLKSMRDVKTRALREEAFTCNLRDVPVSELTAYPGIGPGTVSKLREAGLVDLASLRGSSIVIEGVGQKRLSDIEYAVGERIKKAQVDFDAGVGRHAQTLPGRLRDLMAQFDSLEANARRKAEAANAQFDSLDEMVECASKVTFWRWLRSMGREPLVPSVLLNAPLPALATVPQAPEALADERCVVENPPVDLFNPSVAPPLASQCVAPPPTTPEAMREECLKMLEISENTSLSAELVRRQYHLLFERVSPEKVISMGPEFVALAQSKRVELRRAAEMLLERMGEKLELQPTSPPSLDPRHNPDLDDVFGGR